MACKEDDFDSQDYSQEFNQNPQPFSAHQDEESKSPLTEKSKGRTKRRETLTRKDVVQKTIFRAMRKEYSHFFELFLAFKQRPLNYRVADFKSLLSEFVEYILQWENKEALEAKFGRFKHLSFIIGLMVDFCKSKKVEKTREEASLMAQFYDALYKYSHAKFDRLLEIPEAKFLFSKMLDSSYVDTFIERHSTLAKNAREYKQCASAILSSIESP